MISTKRYPNGRVCIAGELELTDRITSIANPLENMAEPYLVGYATYDNYPAMYNANFCEWVTGGYTINFTHVKENHSFGFCYYEYTNNQYPSTLLYVYNSSEQIVKLWTVNNDNAQFINAATIANLTYTENIKFQIRFMIIRNDAYSFDGLESNFDPDAAGVTNQYHDTADTVIVTIAQLRAMIAGTIPVYHVDITVSGTHIEQDIYYNDFNEYNLAVKPYSDTNYSIAMIVAGYNTTHYAKYNGWTGDQNAAPIVPFFTTTIPEHGTDTTAPAQENAVYMPCSLWDAYIQFRFRNGNWGQCPINDIYFINHITNSNYHLFFGCYPYSFDSAQAIAEIIHNPNGGADYGMGTNRSGIYQKQAYTVFYSGGSLLTFNFYNQIDLNDILKAVSCINKIELGVTDWNDITQSGTYTTDHSTATFTDINGTTLTRLNDDYENISSDLRLWQKPNMPLIVNEYKPEDLPPYDPTPGGEGENVGDNILRPSSLGIGGTNGFVTQYALRAADVQELGEILWTSVFDQDYWQNYLFSLALDTGSFSTSALLSFFVSLKVYPFALINVPSYDDIGKNMYIGTGIKALEFTNNLHTINNYCDYVSGGECTVYSNYFYGDYRDYTNATYTLYIPYCGTMVLNPGDVVKSELHVQYAVDFATGGCVAYVDVKTADGAQFTIGAMPGQMGADVPLTATAAGEVAARFIGDAMNVAGQVGDEVSGIAAGVAGAMTGGKPSGGGNGNMLSGIAAMMGGPMAAVGMDLAPGLATHALNMVTRGAITAPMMSGGRGFASFGAPQTPYVQIRRAIYPEISGLKTVAGAPAAGTYTVGDLSGFVQGDIKTDGLTCPDNDKQKIRALISQGIYI